MNYLPNICNQPTSQLTNQQPATKQAIKQAKQPTKPTQQSPPSEPHSSTARQEPPHILSNWPVRHLAHTACHFPSLVSKSCLPAHISLVFLCFATEVAIWTQYNFHSSTEGKAVPIYATKVNITLGLPCCFILVKRTFCVHSTSIGYKRNLNSGYLKQDSQMEVNACLCSLNVCSLD